MVGQAVGVVGAVVGGGVLDDRGGVRLAVVGDDAGVVKIAFGVVGVEQFPGGVVQQLVRDHVATLLLGSFNRGSIIAAGFVTRRFNFLGICIERWGWRL